MKLKSDSTTSQFSNEDLAWMKKALLLAQRAAEKDEVPVGALVVREGQLLAQAYNYRETWKTVLAHAEIIALHRASIKTNAWRLINCTLYVTLEPCLMCAGAIQQARFSRVVFGAYDQKRGALNSLYRFDELPGLNHRFEITGGVLENECSQILKKFFAKKRAPTSNL